MQAEQEFTYLSFHHLFTINSYKMRKILFTILVLGSASFSLLSCDKKDDETAVAYPTFSAFLQSKPELSMFSQALTKAQLEGFVNGQGPFTWFAPTNDAFAAAKITQDSLNKMTPSQLSYMLLYHLIAPTGIPLVPTYTSDMNAQFSVARTTQMGQSIYMGRYADSFYVNGSAIISADNRVSNGVVHIVKQFSVAPPLRNNLVTILNSTGEHSLFIQALTKANKLTNINGAAVFTVLAPTNAAMTAAGFTANAITAASTASIDSLVRYHMFSGSRLFSNDFGNGTTPSTFLAATKTLIASANGRKFKGISNANAVDVTTANILGTNGVIHVINGVLRY
jgi:uncharacterized surface protein with fasciclin (FAS1) repeats